MTSPRCTWCGGKLDLATQRTHFCGQACQRAYEDWCALRATARSNAVSRWRDMQDAKNGDMLNDLLSIGAKSSSKTYFAGAVMARPET